ncbi:MAG TPA: Fe-only nitrogenase accessory AnfO family protein [Ruminiclostridium sp.]|nr:Fe-only nitrogenase accessory AnfO family protein [Ruminiclostridium sp.]
MSKRIAVIINEEEELSSFERGTRINIYNKNNSQWQLSEEISYYINTRMSISDLRDSIRTLLEKLVDCHIVVGKAMSGIAYNIFDRMGFAIFEANEITSGLLDDIYNEVCSLKAQPDVLKNAVFSPVPTETDGVFYMNLIEMQAEHPEISSKKALRPFLENTPFYKLEVLCSHVPPWFENVLPALGLTYLSEQLENNKFKVSIMKKCVPVEAASCFTKRR